MNQQAKFRWLQWAGVALAITLVVLGVGRMTARSSSSAPPGEPSRGGLTSFPAKSRPHLPVLRGTDLSGKTLDLVASTGHVVVLNLWGSWCAPCRAEAPGLVRAANATKRQGVLFYGIDTRDDRAAAQAFVRRFSVPYPSFDDKKARIIQRFTGIVPISAVPSTMIIDTRSRVAARVVGQVDETTLRGLIADVIGEGVAPQRQGQVSP